MRHYLVFSLLILAFSFCLAAEDATSPTYQLVGDVSLLSHYVENGLSQSNKSPALQGSFWFNFGPQFRLGVWGSNTNYEGSDDHFNLRGLAQINIRFTPTSRFEFIYGQNQFYKAGNRNGSVITGRLDFFSTYRLLYTLNSNWEGTNNSQSRYGLGKDFTVFGSWLWSNELGYNMPKSTSYNAYFDGRSALGTKMGSIYFEGALTGTSESSQFNGAGDFFLILSGKKDF